MNPYPLVGLNHFTVPLAIHVVSAESKKVIEPSVPALTGMPEASGYAGWGRLGSANGMPVSAKKCRFAPDFRRFAGFGRHLTWPVRDRRQISRGQAAARGLPFPPARRAGMGCCRAMHTPS